MANVLPDAFREELQRLQDQVPPRPYQDIEARLREEFGGRAPTEVFAEFSPVPVASASIGQVHRARLPSGEEVAVKVQYPDIEEIVRIDLRALQRIFAVLRWFMPDYGFDTIYTEIREMVLAELDYRREAAAIQKIAANFAARQPPSPQVRFPRVMAEFSTSRVLTTEWMEGIKVADLERLESLKVDRRAAARVCVEAYCQQIFIDGLYHADPHPGNLLVQTPDAPGGPPTIVFLDFGAVATVSEAMRRGMMSFIQGAITRDTVKIVTAMKEMGLISRRADPEAFDRIVQYFHDKMRVQMSADGFSLKDLKFEPEKSLGSLLDLRDLNVSLADLRDAFHIPKEWILLERTLLLLLGVCTTLDPGDEPGRDHRAVPRAFSARREEAVVGDRARGVARDGALGAVAPRRAAALHGPRGARRDRVRLPQPRRERAPHLPRRAADPLGDAGGHRGRAGHGVRRSRSAPRDLGRRHRRRPGGAPAHRQLVRRPPQASPRPPLSSAPTLTLSGQRNI